MTVIITGWRSKIAKEFRGLIPADDAVRGEVESLAFPVTADRYLFCNGLLRPKALSEQTPDEREAGFTVNFTSVANRCDAILANNPLARICVIGSESAYRGSYDGVYAAAKAALHQYVQTKEISPCQQLVAISPGIIGDAGMTTRRTDTDNLERRRKAHPKRRFIAAHEVASLAHHLLFHQPYISGTVIRMHGGEK